MTEALKDIQDELRQRGHGGRLTDSSSEEHSERALDIDVRLAEQGVKIDHITKLITELDTKSHQEEPNGQWSEVVRRKPSKKTGSPPATFRGKGPQNIASEDRPQSTNLLLKRTKRTRPPAILVNINREDFPVLAKKICEGMDHEIIGDRVTRMRQSKSGGLLIEMRGDPSQVELVRAEVSRLAGDEIDVRSLQQRSTLEIRDLDEWRTKEEVASSLIAFYGPDGETFKVVSIRKQHGGTQVAVVTAPPVIAQKAISAGRLRVGMVSCRIKLCERKARCFRCLAFGHTSRTCKGMNRSGCYWRCGTSGEL